MARAMRFLACGSALLLLCSPGYGQTSKFHASGCDAGLWKHVYRPERLKIQDPCIRVTGVIFHIKHEPDGDDHIQLKLDPGFESLLNDRNRSVQHGCLVVEPVCVHSVSQADAVSACQGWKSPFEVPKRGSHLEVVGPWVHDSEANHGWMEIHPPTVLREIK